MEQLPWLDDLLKLVSQEYSKELPSYTRSSITPDDMKYINTLLKDKDPFDELNLKQKMVDKLSKKKTSAWKTISDLGEIIYIGDEEQPIGVWWRCVRLLLKKPVRIVIFGHPSLRKMPHRGSVGPQHINGGYAMRCDATSIVIYRKEEITRVLIHELFHASCSDPYHKDVSELEADTEAWAEIIQCAMIARGVKSSFLPIMKEQIEYSVNQSKILKERYNINNKNDYSWRYAIGRIEVWKKLGLHVPEYLQYYKKTDSLRLTLREPLE